MSSGLQLPFSIQQNVYPSLHIEDRVLGINLEYNNLESLETIQLPSDLIQLYLSNNKLESLPDLIFENQLNLREVSLSGNPWKCDCNALKFKRWLISKNSIVKDINDTRCGSIHKENSKLAGRVIWELTDIDLCPKANVQLIVIVSVVIPLSFVILCLAAKVLYDRYSLNIKVFLYYHGFTFVKEEDLDVDKEFDAFVSFSNADGEFVTKEFINVIETTYPHIGLCIHFLHFLPGEFIYDNIIRYIHKSKKTILILSNHFLESEWCLFEFKTAHMKALQDKVHRVIVVKVGDLHGEIDPAIKAYLASTTYLTWGEENFWRKLIYVLPSRNNTRNPKSSSTGDNEMVFEFPLTEL